MGVGEVSLMLPLGVERWQRVAPCAFFCPEPYIPLQWTGVGVCSSFASYVLSRALIISLNSVNHVKLPCEVFQ